MHISTIITRSRMAAISQPQTAKIFFDGGSRGNPGIAGSGYVVTIGDRQKITGCKYVGDNETNNVAEYNGLISGLECLEKHCGDHPKNIALEIYGDSMLVIKQSAGQWKIKKAHLAPLCGSVVKMASKYKSVKYTHIPREENHEADALSNVAMNSKQSFETELDTITIS